MMIPLRAPACIALVAGLAGCGEFAFDDPPSDQDLAFQALQQETLALRDTIADLAVTPGVDLPVEGSARYSGTARIALDPVGGGTASELIGTAEITADFADATIRGQADGFYGRVDGGDVAAFDGSIFVSGGTIDAGGTGAAQLGADLNGTLSGGGDILVVDGALAGSFLGMTSGINDPPPAVSLGTTEATDFRLNGDKVTGMMEIIGAE